MKKIVTLTIFTLFIIIHLNAQHKELPYKSLEDFNCDTTAFINYNFIERAEHYKNQSFESFLKDLQITPVASGLGYIMGENENINFSSLRLYINRNGKNSLFVQVSWESPAPMPLSMERIIHKYGIHTWTDQHNEVLGNFKIGRIYTNETFRPGRK